MFPAVFAIALIMLAHVLVVLMGNLANIPFASDQLSCTDHVAHFWLISTLPMTLYVLTTHFTQL